jgi:hypothetical protein
VNLFESEQVPPVNQERDDRAFLLRVAGKTLIFLVILNLLFAWLYPMRFLGSLSLYNLIFPGRQRLPYGDDPEQSFNVSVNQLEALFAAHEINRGIDPDTEFRLLIMGDSSVWGFLQEPNETISAQINEAALYSEDGRPIRAYNLGYPTLSLTKDLLLLDHAKVYKPDLILWFVTLESFPIEKQLSSPILEFNPDKAHELITSNESLEQLDLGRITPGSFWERTIFGSRRQLADLIRHQVYGMLWSATGVDHYIPENFELRAEDLSEDLSFQAWFPGEISIDDLAFDVLKAGLQVSPAPIVFINEPIFLSRGENSDIRYNFYYPRWAYDQYREWFELEAAQNQWNYLDLWNEVPAQVFTDSAIHYDVEGVDLVVARILESGYLPISSKER